MPDMATSGERRIGQVVPEWVTHGRHCTCSACAREDWTNADLAPCGMHGDDCPALYQPWAPAGSLLYHPATGKVLWTVQDAREWQVGAEGPDLMLYGVSHVPDHALAQAVRAVAGASGRLDTVTVMAHTPGMANAEHNRGGN